MKSLLVEPVEGRTYSLYGNGKTSETYFGAVAEVVEAVLDRTRTPSRLLELLSRVGQSRRAVRHDAKDSKSDVGRIIAEADSRLGCYFSSVESFRSMLSFIDRRSKTLAMSYEQYLLAAVEIELQNQLNIKRFKSCTEKLALLPHCLRDLEAKCKSRIQGIDAVCMACSSACYLNAVSHLLRQYQVQPYIWMHMSLGKLLRQKATSPTSLGILGISCIPELVAGMRRCAKAGVAVVGLPLDANRCARWFGEFRPNTVNLRELEKLLSDADAASKIKLGNSSTISVVE